MNTIRTPNFSSKIAKIMAEIRTKTRIDDVDEEAIKDILQDMLIEECRMLDGYYEEEYFNELRNLTYAGHSESHSV